MTNTISPHPSLHMDFPIMLAICLAFRYRLAHHSLLYMHQSPFSSFPSRREYVRLIVTLTCWEVVQISILEMSNRSSE